MGGMFASRLDSTLIFISGWRGVALLDCQPHRPRRHFLEAVRPCPLASLAAGGFGHLPAFDGPRTNLLHHGRHSDADWVWIPFPLPPGVSSAALGVGRAGLDPDELLAGMGALSRGWP